METSTVDKLWECRTRSVMLCWAKLQNINNFFCISFNFTTYFSMTFLYNSKRKKIIENHGAMDLSFLFLEIEHFEHIQNNICMLYVISDIRFLPFWAHICWKQSLQSCSNTLALATNSLIPSLNYVVFILLRWYHQLKLGFN